MSLGGIVANAVNRSPFTNALQIQSWDADMWTLEIDLPPLNREQGRELQAWLLSMYGVTGTFTFGDPFGAVPRGNPRGTPFVEGNGQTGRVLNTRGWTPNAQGVLKPGDYIQIGQRLYQCLTTANPDANGYSAFEIFPRLRESPLNGTPIITSNCVGMWRLADDDIEWSLDVTQTYEFRIAAVEAL